LSLRNGKGKKSRVGRKGLRLPIERDKAPIVGEEGIGAYRKTDGSTLEIQRLKKIRRGSARERDAKKLL